MDRKTIFVAVACFGLLIVWSQLVNKIYPPVPKPPPGTNLVSTVGVQTTNPSAPAATSASAATTTGTVTSPMPLLPFSGREETLVVTNTNARYTFTSHGGGVKLIELVGYPETVSHPHNKNLPLTNDLAELNTPHAAAVLMILADESVQGDGEFALTPTATGVRAEKSLTNGLRLVKEFQVSTNYLLHTTVRLENTSSRTLTLPAQEWVIGTATPMGPDDKGQTEGVFWYDGKRTEEKLLPWFENKGFLFWGGVPHPEFRAGQSNVVWAAAENQFFVLIAMPGTPAQQIVSRPVDLPRPSEGPASLSNSPAPKGFQTALVYPQSILEPGQFIERKINFYAGPKEYRTLARVADRFQNSVDLIMGFGGFFGFFSKILLLGMNWLHFALKLPYGWAIIVITIIFKTLFWPLTQASTRSMKRMQALQPQMAAIKEKYKDDPLKANKRTMEFMKENKVSPLGGCLPMLLQMPVFIGFFYMIRTAIELRGATFLWVSDLSKPDTLYIIKGLGFIPFLGTPEGLPINLLPIFMGATMLWQAQLTPPSPGMDPAQAKMMRYMPLIFIGFLYNYSAGLALYWTVQNLLSVLQTKLIKMGDPVKATSTVLTPLSKKSK